VTGSRASTEPQGRLGPEGFDPTRKAICVRLRARQDGWPQTGRGWIDATGKGGFETDPAPQVLINPDGPTAANLIEEMQAEIDALIHDLRRSMDRENAYLNSDHQ
jgi:hypothetical protein